jgi:hypothetical protein
MDIDDKVIDDAIRLCTRATEQGVLIMLRENADEDADMIVTNASTPEQVAALGQALAGDYTDSVAE